MRYLLSFSTTNDREIEIGTMTDAYRRCICNHTAGTPAKELMMRPILFGFAAFLIAALTTTVNAQVEAPKPPTKKVPPIIRDHRDPPPVIRDHRVPPVIRDHRTPPTPPVIRDHRVPPVIRDHRTPPTLPVIRDHRTPPTLPVVRDHRTPPTLPVVRDHRTPPTLPVVRDHRAR